MELGRFFYRAEQQITQENAEARAGLFHLTEITLNNFITPFQLIGTFFAVSSLSAKTRAQRLIQHRRRLSGGGRQWWRLQPWGARLRDFAVKNLLFGAQLGGKD